MASVKLFHVTEFAESLFQSPLAHRTALHPLVMLLLVALWLATAGHWPLWQTLLMHTEAGAVRPAMALAVFAHLFLGALIWLALTCWRWTFKPAITLLLVWAALGSCAMWLLRAAGEAMSVSPVGLMQFLLKSENWSRLLSLPCLLTLVAVFLIPALLIWRTSLFGVGCIRVSSGNEKDKFVPWTICFLFLFLSLLFCIHRLDTAEAQVIWLCWLFLALRPFS